jgi:hypothetical protein
MEEENTDVKSLGTVAGERRFELTRGINQMRLRKDMTVSPSKLTIHFLYVCQRQFV